MMRPSFMEKLLQQYTVNQLPLNKGLVLEESTPLSSALTLMRNEKSGHVLTSDGKKMTGIFTEHDFMKVVVDKSSWKEPISRFTTKKPWVVQVGAQLLDVIRLMKEKKIRHVPVLNADQSLLGVLSVRNVIKLFAEHFPADVMNLPPRAHTNAPTREGG